MDEFLTSPDEGEIYLKINNHELSLNVFTISILSFHDMLLSIKAKNSYDDDVLITFISKKEIENFDKSELIEVGTLTAQTDFYPSIDLIWLENFDDPEQQIILDEPSQYLELTIFVNKIEDADKIYIIYS